MLNLLATGDVLTLSKVQYRTFEENSIAINCFRTAKLYKILSRHVTLIFDLSCRNFIGNK